MKRRSALLVCVLAAASLHLLLLLWPVGPRGVAARPAGGGAALRVVNLQMALPTAPAPAAREAVAAAPTSEPAPAHASAAEAALPAPVLVPPAAGPGGATEGTPLAIEPDWWRREQLDRGPQPLRPVLFDTVRAGTGLLPVGSNALLLIDETGRVQRVEFGGTPLPTAAEDALRAAFEATPFAPGERGGRPVRAKVRIAVDLVIDLNDGAR